MQAKFFRGNFDDLEKYMNEFFDEVGKRNKVPNLCTEF